VVISKYFRRQWFSHPDTTRMRPCQATFLGNWIELPSAFLRHHMCAALLSNFPPSLSYISADKSLRRYSQYNTECFALLLQLSSLLQAPSRRRARRGHRPLLKLLSTIATIICSYNATWFSFPMFIIPRSGNSIRCPTVTSTTTWIVTGVVVGQ
jgi:hypothetical protein